MPVVREFTHEYAVTNRSKLGVVSSNFTQEAIIILEQPVVDVMNEGHEVIFANFLYVDIQFLFRQIQQNIPVFVNRPGVFSNVFRYHVLLPRIHFGFYKLRLQLPLLLVDEIWLLS